MDAQEQCAGGEGSAWQDVGFLGTASAGAGAALTSAVASACCTGPVIAPLVISVLGAGGAAWAAGLKPYSPYLLAVSALMMGYGFWGAYRPRIACRPGDGRADGQRRARIVKGVLWASAVLWAVGLGLNLFLAPS